MTWLRRVLWVAIGVELLVAAVLFGRRLNSTRPDPPPVALHHDAMTAGELLKLPDRFVFDGVEKWHTLGKAYLAYGYFAKAEACLSRAALADPHNARFAFAHGFCLERLGKFAAANEAFRRAATEGPEEIAQACWYHIGRNGLRAEQPEAAAAAFLQAGERHSPSLFQRAKLLVRHGQAESARPLLGRLADSFPDDLYVRQLRAQAAREMEQTTVIHQARDALERARPTLLLSDIQTYLMPIRRQYGLAREIDQAQAELNEGRPNPPLKRLAGLLEQDSRWDNSFPLLLQNMATLQASAGEMQIARALVERQFEHQGFPTAIAWELKGDIALHEGRADDAWSAWLHADRMQPSASIHRKLARLAEARDDRAESRRRFALAGLFIGMGYIRDDRLERALSVFREATTFDDELPHLWHYIGETERLLGHRADAEYAYQRTLELDPAHGRALAALQRLNGRP